MNLKSNIQKDVYEALKKLNVNYDFENIIIDTPKDRENGDFSCNISMKLAKEMHDSPLNIANKIIENLNKEKLSKVEVAGPGFINFYLKDSFIFSYIKEILSKEDAYGSCEIGKEKKINLEYVSANPTGILHLGTARGAAYGDNLSNILKFTGYDVTREYYVNDGGNQINNLGISLYERYKELCGLECNIPEDGYFGSEITDIAKKIHDEFNDSKLNDDIEYFKDYAVKYLLDIIKNDLKDFGVEFDVWSSEKAIRKEGTIEKALEIFKEKNLTYEEDGALFLKTTEYGDDKDRVLIKSDKSYTYLVPDIAYHLNKFKRGFDYLIDVFGADHHSYVSRLKASIEALGYDKDKLEVRLLQMVRLIKDGEEVKMSKRKGGNVTIRDLMDEIGKDSIRYFFASRSLDTQMDFDLSLALKKSNENPFFYVGYAHARIASLLNEASERGYNIKSDVKDIVNDDSKNLILKVYEFEDVVKASSIKKEPHLVTNYVYELASLFHNYYAKHKVITDDRNISEQQLALCKCVKITIKNALKLIGVSAPNKM